MLSGKSLDDFRPLLTGGLMAYQLPQGVVATPEWAIPPELGGQQQAPTQQPGQQEEFVIPQELMPMAVQTMGSENVAPKPSPFSNLNPQLQP
jgi:hypothetical protein